MFVKFHAHVGDLAPVMEFALGPYYIIYLFTLINLKAKPPILSISRIYAENNETFLYYLKEAAKTMP